MQPNATDFEGMMRNMGALPLWVKQVIYTSLRIDLEATLSKKTLDMFGPDDLLQLHVPETTAVGNKELDQPSGRYGQDILRFLHMCRQKKSIANIAILNQWTLENTNSQLLLAINHQLVHPPKSGTIKATIDYIAGITRLGEYLVKINRLTTEQLDQALRTQKYIEESMGEKTGIANVLINLGYIKKEDSEGILFLKEESKKQYQGLGSAGGSMGSIGGAPPPLPGGLPRTPPVPVQYPSTGGQQPQQQRPAAPAPGQQGGGFPPPGQFPPPLPQPGQGGGFPPPGQFPPPGSPLPPPGQGGGFPPPGQYGPLPPPDMGGGGLPPFPPGQR